MNALPKFLDLFLQVAQLWLEVTIDNLFHGLRIHVFGYLSLKLLTLRLSDHWIASFELVYFFLNALNLLPLHFSKLCIVFNKGRYAILHLLIKLLKRICVNHALLQKFNLLLHFLHDLKRLFCHHDSKSFLLHCLGQCFNLVLQAIDFIFIDLGLFCINLPIWSHFSHVYVDSLKSFVVHGDHFFDILDLGLHSVNIIESCLDVWYFAHEVGMHGLESSLLIVDNWLSLIDLALQLFVLLVKCRLHTVGKHGFELRWSRHLLNIVVWSHGSLISFCIVDSDCLLIGVFRGVAYDDDWELLLPIDFLFQSSDSLSQEFHKACHGILFNDIIFLYNHCVIDLYLLPGILLLLLLKIYFWSKWSRISLFVTFSLIAEKKFEQEKICISVTIKPCQIHYRLIVAFCLH